MAKRTGKARHGCGDIYAAYALLLGLSLLFLLSGLSFPLENEGDNFLPSPLGLSFSSQLVDNGRSSLSLSHLMRSREENRDVHTLIHSDTFIVVISTVAALSVKLTPIP